MGGYFEQQIGCNTEDGAVTMLRKTATANKKKEKKSIVSKL